jgi:uncharacterized protein
LALARPPHHPELGFQHEARYLKALAGQGLKVVNIDKAGSQSRMVEATLAAMKEGVDVIAQGALSCGRWFGRPDVLRKVDKPSPAFGSYSYQPHDCKLARETKATTILQLSFIPSCLPRFRASSRTKCASSLRVRPSAANRTAWPNTPPTTVI